MSKDKEGYITITLNNLSLKEDIEIDTIFAELEPVEIQATILQGDIHNHNTFENPNLVKEEVFTNYQIAKNHVCFTIPAHSIIQMRLK